jgi:cell wall arabinan synthesis protein
VATQTQAAVVRENGRRTPDRQSEPRRVRIAQGLAFIAVVAALIGALGPAKPIRATYSWPPRSLPHAHPSRLWYTPLLLSHRVPESLSALVPCRLPAPLPQADSPTSVLATARHPDRSNGLEVTRSGTLLTFRIGTSVIDEIRQPTDASAGGHCAYQLTIADGRWALAGGPKASLHGGVVPVMPVVNGLFSGLDLRSSSRPSIDIAVVPQSARPILRQSIAWLVAALCALGALLLVSLQPRPERKRPRVRMLLRRAAKSAHPADAAIVVLLLLWWVLAPANSDDGWVETTERMFRTSGGFSNYFDALATNLPLSYWLDWLQHWLTTRTTALVLLRVPALLSLLVAWALCRWTLERVLGPHRRGGGSVLWALAAMFVVSSSAWDLTLRPEPTIALLTAGVLASTVAFHERKTTAPLALAVVLCALAVTTHPAGIVSLAPLLAAGPTVVRWSRSHFAAAATIVPAAIALAITLATVGSDVAHRNTDTQTFRTFGDATLSWRDEILRYEYLSWPFFGTPMRRVSVALLLLVVLCYALRRRERDEGLLNVPARALALGLALLILNPDKLSWHFGTLLALGSVAAAAETSRLRDEASAANRSAVLPFLWVLGAAVAAAWAWPVRQFWDSLDLRTLRWTLGFESAVPLATVAAALPLIALLGVGTVGFLRGGRGGVRAAPWRVARWSIPLVVVPVLVFTLGVLSADAAKTSSWTLTAQNIDALRGTARCGLADHLVTPVPSLMRPVSLVQPSPQSTGVPGWVPPPPLPTLRRFTLGPVTSGTVRTPWFTARGARPLGVFVGGAIGPDTNLALEFARIGRGRVRYLTTEALSAGSFARGLRDQATWLFLLPSQSSVAPRANAVRVALTGNGGMGEALAVTAPVTYATRSLTSLERGASTLTNPFVVPYFPCAREPQLSRGSVAVPSAIVTFPSPWHSSPPRLGQTFDGLGDLYPLIRLPLLDGKPGARGTAVSGTRPADLVLYASDTRIPGASAAPPSVATSG